eukprot:gene18821-20717_t
MRRSHGQNTRSQSRSRFTGGKVFRDYLPYRREYRNETGNEDRTCYFCDLCKQQMSNKKLYIQHCESEFHKEKAVKSNNDSIWKCHSCNKGFLSKEEVDQHCLSNGHKSSHQAEGVTQADDNEKSTEATSEAEEGKTPLRTMFSFGPLVPPNYCKVCKLDCVNPSKLRVHLESWRHKAECDRRREEREEEVKKAESAKKRKEEDEPKKEKLIKDEAKYERKSKEDNRDCDRDGRGRKGKKDKEKRTKNTERSKERSRERSKERSSDHSRSNERMPHEERSRERSRDKKESRDKRMFPDKSSRRGEKKSKTEIDNESHKELVQDEGVVVQDEKTKQKHDNDEDRTVRIKVDEVEDEDRVHDLRDKLNKGKNIVITKKVKDEKRADSVENIVEELSEERNVEESDLKEELFKIRLKSDVLMQEQLVREHNIEILQYKEAEDEYKRLCLEESFLKRRLSMFRDDDPRRDNDKQDLLRLENAIEGVREELALRDLVIQEKERSLIILKDRMKENAVHTFSKPKKSLVSQDEIAKKKEDDDLRTEIEKERLLRKIEPELKDVDPLLRQKILDALDVVQLQNTSSRKEQISNRNSDLREELDYQRINNKRPSALCEDGGDFKKVERSSMTKEEDKKKQSHHRSNYKKQKSKESKILRSYYSSDDDDEEKISRSKKHSSSKTRNAGDKRRENRASKEDDNRSREGRRRQRRSVSPTGKKRGRSRSNSFSSDEKKTSRDKSKRRDSSQSNKKSNVTRDVKEMQANETYLSNKKDDEMQNIVVISQERRYITGLNIYDEKNEKPSISEVNSNLVLDRIPTIRELTDTSFDDINDKQRSSRPREQFALWKLTNHVEESKEDIWDTAIGPGQRDTRADTMSIDIFTNTDEVPSDYTHGKLITTHRSSKETRVEMPICRSVAMQRETTNVITVKKGLEQRQMFNTNKMPQSAFMSKTPERLPENQNLIKPKVNVGKSVVKRGILKKPTERFKEKDNEETAEVGFGILSKKKEAIPGLNLVDSSIDPAAHQKEGTEKSVPLNDLDSINSVLSSTRKQQSPELQSTRIEPIWAAEKQSLFMPPASESQKQTHTQGRIEPRSINPARQALESPMGEDNQGRFVHDGKTSFIKQSSMEKSPLFPASTPAPSYQKPAFNTPYPANNGRKVTDANFSTPGNMISNQPIAAPITEKPIFSSELSPNQQSIVDRSRMAQPGCQADRFAYNSSVNATANERRTDNAFLHGRSQQRDLSYGGTGINRSETQSMQRNENRSMNDARYNETNRTADCVATGSTWNQGIRRMSAGDFGDTSNNSNPQRRHQLSNTPARDGSTLKDQRSLPMGNASKANDVNAFKYIFNTVNEYTKNGLFHCIACNTFLATDNDRTMHAYTQAHLQSVKRKDGIKLAPNASPNPPVSVMPLMHASLRPRNPFGSHENNPHTPSTPMRRPTRTYRPTSDGKFRPRGNFNPRSTGPYY